MEHYHTCVSMCVLHLTIYSLGTVNLQNSLNEKKYEKGDNDDNTHKATIFL